MVKHRNLLPRQDAGAQAVRQVQGVHEDEARLALVILHAPVEPFDMAHDMLKMVEIVFDFERPCVFGGGQRAKGVCLTEMNQRADLPCFGRVDVATNQGINQGGFTDAGYSFDEQRIEWRDNIISHD